MSAENVELCVSKLKVLAEDTRLKVVLSLMERPKHVGELAESLSIGQSLLSHHLKILRDAQLVVDRRDGKSVLYEVAPEVEAISEGKVINIGCCRLSFPNQI